MRTDEFVLRGQNAGDGTADSIEILNFSGFKPGYAYRLVEFQIYPSTNIGGANYEVLGSITAGKIAVDPRNPDFSDEGLIAVAKLSESSTGNYNADVISIVNDTFLITQNLILQVRDTAGGAAVNWQCKFMPVKMTKAQEAVTNYKQFTISDE